MDPDILIVDEVLAVGDVEFQRKCLGKMKDVSGEGRTVLFVSHNMTAIKNLCSSSILMDNGTITKMGVTDELINNYLSHNLSNTMVQVFDDFDIAPGNKFAKVKRFEVRVENSNNQIPITINTSIESYLNFEFRNRQK